MLFFFLSGSDTFVKTYQDIWSLTQLPTLWGVDSEVLPWFTQQCRPLDWGYMMWTMGFWFIFRIISPCQCRQSAYRNNRYWTPGWQGLFVGSATHKNEFPVWTQVRNHQDALQDCRSHHLDIFGLLIAHHQDQSSRRPTKTPKEMITALVYSAILPFKNSIQNWKFTVSCPLISSWSLYTLWIFCGFWPQGWRAVKPSWSSRWQLSWSCLRRPCWPRGSVGRWKTMSFWWFCI